jgi:predicted branched-subunit amino acid permease
LNGIDLQEPFMEFTLLAVFLVFMIPFPAKWKIVSQVRYLALALFALTAGFTLFPQYGLTGQIAGIALILAAVLCFYMVLRLQRSTRRTAPPKK